MSVQKQEDKESSIDRLAATTARFPHKNHSPPFYEAHAFGYNPYATVHLRKIRHRPQHSDVSSLEKKSRLNEIANTPFKRINRVEQLIRQHKNQLGEGEDAQGIKLNHSLRPHFKVKTSKTPARQHHPTCNAAEEAVRKLHLHNLSLEYAIKVQPTQIHSPRQDPNSPSNFAEIIKNRRKLNRKSPRKKIQASLLDMLNRISDGIPLHRYKSKAFDNSSKVSTFLHS